MEGSLNIIKNKNVTSSELKKEIIINNKNKRNYGIDLLRIFAMINIIILHINLYSHQLSVHGISHKNKITWILQGMSMWAVNGFGLISGIVGYKKYNFSNLIYIWIQTSFYSSFFTIYFNIIKKKTINKKIINKKIINKKIILSFFPILIKRHWYINAYFCMYLFLPFINYGINNLNSLSYRNIIIFFISFYSVYDIISKLIYQKRQNYHFLNSGYTAMWLLTLYVIGGYFGKYIINKTHNQNKLLYYAFWIMIYLIFSYLSSEMHFILIKKKSKITHRLFINYLSPTIIFESIALLMIFSKINIKIDIINKIISFFTPLTFNTTLIHLRIFQENNSFKKKLFNWVRKFKSNYFFFKIYLLAIIIYIICSFIDYIRLLIFKILKIRQFSIFISEEIPKILNKII